MPNQLYFDQVQKSIARGEFEAAKSILKKALEENGPFFLYHECLGDIAERQGHPDEATDHYKRALELKPDANWISQKLAPGTKIDTRKGSRTFVGAHHRLPDRTGKRQVEGGTRLNGVTRESLPGKPLVTIVTAVYDNTTTFQRCIDSIKAQTYDNVEYIIVDGGSPAGTLDILKANADFIDYYVSEPDNGIYSAMNKGISLAKGDYVCLLNSDDVHDPDFVKRSVEVALAEPEGVDIVYSDFYDGDTRLPAQPLSPGLMLGNLNINHCTFLVHKSCYDDIGPYAESLKIVSDMVWMRKAYTSGKRFKLLSEAFFRFSHGGASSGNSPDRRRKIIYENGYCYRQDFPTLSQEEGETLYLLRFTKDKLPAVLDIVKKNADQPQLLAAIAGYIEHCFRDRGAFRLSRDDADSKFPIYIELADLLGVDKKHIRMETAQGCLSEILGRIADTPRKEKQPGGKRILHYATVFSAPSETFIYDLVTRLEEETLHDNIMLFQQPQLRDERPYQKSIELSWPHFRPEVRQEIYRYIVETLEIDVMIAHFAINEHRLHQRVAETGIKLPTIVMTHGIDVFTLKQESEYSKHVLQNLAKRDDVAFTAVSDYLRGELTSVGVADDKITVLPNTVNDRFFAHRKTSDFYDRSRPLKLLCIGRLIKWKGHRFLIEAMAKFKQMRTDRFELTIVYGNGDDELEALQAQAKALGVQEQIRFEAFVNFQSTPDYHSRFDCYIHSSTYTEDEARKSETFGVAVLEAIAAGLPVISADAGGLPEVLGYDSDHSRIVKHGDADAICDALVSFYDKGSAFTDNLAYAEERLRTFSARNQIAQLSRLMHKITQSEIKVALFSSSTLQGAGYAAYRVHRGLLDSETVAPTMHTTIRAHQKEPGVKFIANPSGDGNRWRTLQLPAKEGHTIFTVNHTSVRSEDLVKMVEDYDVINLHWHARFLSIENIATLTRLNKPVVMTIRDMQPLTGGCHFFHGCDRWQNNCADCPQIQTAYTEFPSKVLQAKQLYYDFSNLTIVTISNHTRQIVQKSPYFNRCRLETIPNSIETDVFRPYDKAQVRKEFGLPQDRKIIGYVPSFSSEVKGYREILEAFRLLKEKDGEDPFVMLVGNETPATKEIGFDKKTLGYISDNAKLARAYAAADVVVVPSLEETFSNTAAEAVSCGVPVVGFRTGAIPDLARNGETGYTYEVGDVPGLAEGIHKVLTGPDMSKACRALAENMLSFMNQATRYEALFQELAASNLRRPSTRAPRIFNSFEEPGYYLSAIAAETLAKAK